MTDTRSRVSPLDPLPHFAGRGGRVEAAYTAIKNAIIDRSLPPGAPLIELDLAAQLKVSRTPIREALQKLEQERLVRRGSRGLEVSAPTPEDVFQIYDVRIALEELAARSAATLRTPVDLAQIRSALRAGTSVELGESAAVVAANELFHRAIWNAAHNAVLTDMLERLHPFLVRFPSTTLKHRGRWDSARDEHAELAAAVNAMDAQAAGEIARAHFERAREIRLEQL